MERFLKNPFVSVLALLATVPLVSISRADEMSNPYSFGGSCASQGQWTAQALNSSQQIYHAVTQVKDNPKCKAYSNAIRSVLAPSTEQIQEVSQDENAVRLASLPAEIGALRTYATNEGLRADVMKLLLDRSYLSARLNAENKSNTSSLGTRTSLNLVSLGNRLKRAGNSGLSVVEAILDRQSEMDECVMGEDNRGHILAASINMAASVISSNGNTPFASRFTKVLSKLNTTIRDSKYSNILRKMNSQELLMSMSCLLETTSDVYCTTRDTMTLFGLSTDQISRGKDLTSQATAGRVMKAQIDFQKPIRTRSGQEVANPFEGYYVLATQVPVLSEWLAKIQMGVEPKLPTDGENQIGILADLHDYQVRRVRALASFNKNMAIFKNMSDQTLEKRQNFVFGVLQDIVVRLTTNHEEASQNFFTQAKTEALIPFYLLGEDRVPNVVAGILDPGQMQIGWQDYVSTGGKFTNVAKMKDPAAAMISIGERLREIIESAGISANQYFSDLFLVDQPNTIAEASTDSRYTVLDALVNTDRYLTHLLQRIQELKGETSIVPMLVQTQTRIRTVLESFKEVRAMGKNFLNRSLADKELRLDEEEDKKIMKAYEKIVDSVFQEFNVRNQRSSFFSTRISTAVRHDYSLIKRMPNLNDFASELYLATGQRMVDQLVGFYSGNPATLVTDLYGAMHVGSENIAGVEMFLKDSLISYMSYLKMVSEGKQPGNWTIAWDSFKRLFRDTSSPRKFPGVNKVDLRTQAQVERPVVGALAGGPKFAVSLFDFLNFGQMYFKYDHFKTFQDRYPMRIPPFSTPGHLDDEFHSAKFMLAKLCVQTLSFTDWVAFQPFCDGIKLQSSLGANTPKVAPGDNLVIDYNYKAYEEMKKSPELNRSKRICAFRDWGRRNYVFWQTLLLDNGRSADQQ